MSNHAYSLADFLELITLERAEGLTLRSGENPVVDLDTVAHVVEGPPLSHVNAGILLRELTDETQIKKFRDAGSIRFVYTYKTGTQFQVEARVEGDELHIELRRLDTENSS